MRNIAIRHNVIAGNQRSEAIEENLFFANRAPALGANARTGDPVFLAPAACDFRPGDGSNAIVNGPDIGVYDRGAPVPPGTDWWRLRQGPWLAQVLPAGSHYRTR